MLWVWSTTIRVSRSRSSRNTLVWGLFFASGHPPVDGADIVTGLVGAHFREVDAPATQFRQTVACLVAHDPGGLGGWRMASIAKLQQVAELHVGASQYRLFRHGRRSKVLVPG